jgi:Cof subfamily protein (haloacid dehalogenase superfamily)
VTSSNHRREIGEVSGPESLPKVVATDLDGTFLRGDGTVSERSRRALAAAEDAGALVVLVTGRPPRWMAPVIEQTGHRGIAVCANGALVYDLHTEAVVEEHLIEPEIATEIVNALRDSVPGLTFAVERGARGFAHEPSYRPGWDTDDKLVAELTEILQLPMAKLLARHPDLDPDTLLSRARDVVGELATLTHSSRDGLLEISAAGVSKASTLELLCHERGYAAPDVIAFGDMPNDVPMLSWAGYAVAVANAHPDVVDVVDEVTASNDDDGVAVVLERWV